MKFPFVHRKESRWLPFLDWGIVLAAIALFTAAVLPNLLGASAYFDEGYSAYLAKLDILSIAGYTAQDVHPPLYYIALHIWQNVAGDSVQALRFLSVIFGWVALIFGFLIVRRWFGRQTAWLAVLLMALSPLFIRYGASMRMYTMALAIAFAGTYVLLRALGSRNKWWWVTYAILVAAGMWTNYFMALVWATHLIWLIYEYRGERDTMRKWAWAMLGAFILYLPWLPQLLFRYGEIQVNGFWIKPLSVDTLASTVTQSFVFRSASDTTGWVAVGIIILIITLSVCGKRVYDKLKKQQKPQFRLVAAMASLPVILLAVGSLPPLRSSYVYRYVLVAAVSSCLLIAIVVTYARFRRRNTLKRVGLYVLAFAIFLSGALHAVVTGNRNLDTNAQNKLGSVIRDSQQYIPAPMVIRSPYSYYAAALYETEDHPIYYIYSKELDKIGSSRPLYEHHDKGVRDFSGFNLVWIAGEDKDSVRPPQKRGWKTVDEYVRYDDLTKKPAAFATLYERIDI